MSKHIAHVVFKYPLSESGFSLLDGVLIPGGAVVHVGAQHASDPLPTLWVQHAAEWDGGGEPPQVTTTRQLRINIVATGQPFTPDASGHPATGSHVGSAVCANGNLVWHVYASETEAS